MVTEIQDRYFVYECNGHDNDGSEIVEIFVLDRSKRNEVVMNWLAYNANFADCRRKRYWAQIEANRLNLEWIIEREFA